MPNTKDAQRFLESLHRYDLAKLLSHCRHEVRKTQTSGFRRTSENYNFVITAPVPIAEAIQGLAPHDRERMGQALSSGSPDSWQVSDAAAFEVETEGKLSGPEGLLGEFLVQRELMIDVATGGKRIQDMDDYYVAREARIAQVVETLALNYQNPYTSLWDWYHHWRTNFPSYAERREHIRELFKAAIDATASRSPKAPPSREPTGWERVDRALAKARGQIEGASTEEEFQGVGLLCREILISVAQAVYDPDIHPSQDGVQPSKTDAKRMVEAFLAVAVPGDGYKEVRAHARASYDLAVQLQHRRTADYRLAALCLEATSSTVHVLAILADRRTT